MGSAIHRPGGSIGLIEATGGQSLTTLPSGFVNGTGYTPGSYRNRLFQPITSATYVSGTGILTMNFASAPFGAAVGTQANGSSVTVAGLTGTGVAALNATADHGDGGIRTQVTSNT